MKSLRKTLPFVVSSLASIFLLVFGVIPRSSCHRYARALSLSEHGRFPEAIEALSLLPEDYRSADSLRRAWTEEMMVTREDSIAVYAELWLEGRASAELVARTDLSIGRAVLSWDGSRCAAICESGGSGKLCVFETRTGELLESLQLAGQGWTGVADMDFTADSRYLALAVTGSLPHVLSLETGRVTCLGSGSSSTSAVSICPDGSTVASIERREVVLRDPRSGLATNNIRPADEWLPVDVALSPGDGGLLALLLDHRDSEEGRLVLYSMPSLNRTWQIDVPQGTRYAARLVWNRSGTVLAAPSSGSVLVWSVDSLGIRLAGSIATCEGGGPGGMDLSPGDRLLAATGSGEIVLADLVTDSIASVRDRSLVYQPVGRVIRFTSWGGRLVTVTSSGEIWEWRP